MSCSAIEIKRTRLKYHASSAQCFAWLARYAMTKHIDRTLLGVV
jgi:hypothetical protein